MNDVASMDAVPEPVPVDVRPRRILIDGRASDLPEALRMIAAELSQVAAGIIRADRVECDVDLMQGATTSVRFRISAWKAAPLT